MNKYLTGEMLYGDDFSIEQIKEWYEAETEAYADLGSKDISNYSYGYHELNTLHGFDVLPNKQFNHVLGFGAAWGHEFEPILSRLNNITIIEPSDNLRSDKIGNVIPSYVKPEVDGTLVFEDNTFDLITCFGTLHHIPNVSYVIKEMLRVLQPGGFLLLREPIISMGDWNKPRTGLTKNERGIPVAVFDQLFKDEKVEVFSKSYCFVLTSHLQGKIGKYLAKPIFRYKSYLIFDKIISSMFAGNLKYHAQSKLERIAPSSAFYVVKK